MKKLFYPGESIENKITFYHVLIFLLALPFDRFYSTVVLVSFLIHRLIYLRKETLNFDRTILFLQAVFFVSVLSSMYANDFSAALNVVTKQLAIFLFPLLFATSSLDIWKYRSRVMIGFAMGCACTVLYLYYDALRVVRFEKLPLKALFSHAFVNHNFSLPIDLHATYFSMFLVMSAVFLLKEIFTTALPRRRIIYIICVMILAAGLVQLSSKAAFIALFVILTVGFPWLVFSRKKAVYFLIATVAVSVVSLAIILSVNTFRERWLVDFKNDLHNASESETLTWRRSRWDVATVLIRRSPVIGNGTGSEIPMLKELYFERKMYAAYLGSLNAHNQYLSFLINSGLLGLLVYLATLAWGFWKAMRKRDLMLLSFIILISVVSFSEDILDVNKGIFFYAFFFPFLTMAHKKINKAEIQRQP